MMKVSPALHAVPLGWVGLALMVSPFLLFHWERTSVYDNQRMVQLSCGLLALVAVVAQWALGQGRMLGFRRPIALALALFFGLGLLSVHAAHSPRHAFLEWGNLLLLLGLTWLMACAVHAQGGRLLDRLLLAAGMACAIYLTGAAALYVGILRTGTPPEMPLLIFGYDNYRFFNHVQTISLPLLGLLAARMQSRDRRAFWWAITALWWMLLFVGMGRGTLVGLTAGLACTVLLLGRAAWPWCRAMLLSGLAGLIAYLLLYVIVPVLMGMAPIGLLFAAVERTVDNPVSGRMDLWLRALELIQASPWLGSGPAHFAHYARDIPYGAGHPHNWLLQIGSEWGVPAVLLLGGVLLWALYRLWLLRPMVAADQQATLSAFFATGWAILLDGLVSGLIVFPTSQLWIALYLGCAWGWAAAQSGVHPAPLPPSRTGRLLIVLFGLVLVYGVVDGIWREWQARPFAAQFETPAYEKQRPRVWREGRF